MYDNTRAEPMRAEVDSRVSLMEAFVQADDDLRELCERRELIEKDIAVTRDKRAEFLGRLSDALGISGSENKASDDAINALRDRLIR